jgi:hypothetical protein
LLIEVFASSRWFGSFGAPNFGFQSVFTELKRLTPFSNRPEWPTARRGWPPHVVLLGEKFKSKDTIHTIIKNFRQDKVESKVAFIP